jgi:hypothetical protein
MHELASKLGEFKRTGRELNFCCPFCVKRIGRPDTKFHLYVNPSKYLHGIRGWYFCQRCEARGPISRIIGNKQLDRTDVSKWKEFVAAFKAGAKAPKPKPQTVELPRDYMTMIEGCEAHEYLQRRGINDSQIADYNIGFGTEDLRDIEPKDRKHYAGSGRIVFPDYDTDGRIVYWVARTYVGHQIKYKNPASSNARDKVYNLARASNYSQVIITEGVISALASGDDAVAVYGKDVTNTQIKMLAAAGFDRYVVALDGDARSRAVDVADRLSRKGCSAWLVEFDKHEDPANVEDVRSRFDNALEFSVSNRVSFVMC